MSNKTTITPALFEFFKELKAHNNREWFASNKQRYEEVVREPLLQFIADFAEPLEGISQHFVADSRRQGGSLFRIHRDTRFAKDKSPYKTAAGIHFRHQAANSVHAPGFYLHLEPDNVFVGAGIWKPDSTALAKIRDAIVAKPNSWKKLVSDQNLANRFQFEGDKTKSTPRGFDAAHPCIEDIKRKDFIIVAHLDEKQVCSPQWLRHYAELCEQSKPLMRFLTAALELPW
jgi:uncharacterized protein (TIGR02453 family)